VIRKKKKKGKERGKKKCLLGSLLIPFLSSSRNVADVR